MQLSLIVDAHFVYFAGRIDVSRRFVAATCLLMTSAASRWRCWRAFADAPLQSQRCARCAGE